MINASVQIELTLFFSGLGSYHSTCLMLLLAFCHRAL